MSAIRPLALRPVLLLALLGSLPAARAEVRLSAIFSDHMVLQCDARVPVWGWAGPREQVTVEIAGQKKAATADAAGKWMVKLDPMSASTEPRTLSVSSPDQPGPGIQRTDVLIGEVWLGSGQSNMVLTVNRAKDYEQEQAAAKFPLIRMFKEESGAAKTAQVEAKGRWVLCAPDTVGAFSAALYFFGREIHQRLAVPVGLVNSSVGGTAIEAWISPEAQHASVDLQPLLQDGREVAANASPEEAAKTKYENDLASWNEAAKKARAKKQKAPRKPRNPLEMPGVGGLFNGKIAPLIPYAIRGVLWYQGEANSTGDKAQLYQVQLPLLVKDWRARWGYDFPFAWAQLPNFEGPGRDWPTVREAMLKTLALPHTGMGINIDIGDPKNIHPTNKQEVGRRLSLWALGTVYGQKVPATSGPLPAGHQVRGGEMVLRFSHADGGLVAKSGELKGFVVAGADRQWQPAQARIAGDTVIVSSLAVKHPLAARYAWENSPVCTLYNGAGLPATPFRTDDWK